ncbi:UDP-3-O-acyl-N-acetylglucosamine deacetylase [Wohlfahrtiimonas larvae]|uniref:UDP-3-O-acyl-N-acetylglucosamine deacetylase n=1 Tax=Wohlfahrtiimonas larvae TaxID=1157986 RepID=A0ABP9MNE0_9GAMM|nr:UDP-3-O-acyl-N-acetylglucosamine deacetylase [Wohlfahrtiimonas larvae]
MIKQRTLKQKISTVGIGLHSGKKVSLTLTPMPIDFGIQFKRSDIANSTPFAVSAEGVIDTMLATKIASHPESKETVSTVEHLMAVLAAFGVDNVLIEVSAAEVPIMDGSSAPFVYLLQSAGIIDQDAPKRFIKIKKTVSVNENDKVAKLEPYNGFSLDFTINFDHPVLSRTSDHVECDFSAKIFIEEFSRARTFGFMRDFERMRELNLGLGGSLDNAIVVDDYRILNEGGLRYPDEFVRHKLLDAVGDLYQLGFPILGKFVGYKAGHRLNNLLIRELMNRPDAYEWVTCEEEDFSILTQFNLPTFVHA